MNLQKKPYYIYAFCIIIILWWFYPAIVETLSEKTNTHLDGSTDRLGALFSALAFAGLFLTIFYQRKDFIDMRKYNNMNEFIELYRYFISPEFRETRRMAWSTLRKCIQNPDYADYVLGESYMERYAAKLTEEQLFEKFKHIHTAFNSNSSVFCVKDSEFRHKLDDLINFYQLLSIKETSNKYFETVDFFYDSWRPMLYWYALKSEVLYLANPINKSHNNPPGLLTALKRLDDKFYCPEDASQSSLSIDNIEYNVLIKAVIDAEKKDS